MSDQQPPSSPGWVPPGQPQPPPPPWTPPPGQQPPAYTPSGGTSIPPPPPTYQQPGPPAWSAPTAQQPAWQSQPPPGGPQGPWQPQPPMGPGGPKSKAPLVLAGLGVLIVLAIIAAVIIAGGGDDDKEAATTTTAATSSSTTEDDSTTTTEPDETTTTTETPSSGELEVPEPISGFQVFEDPAGEFAVTFPEDWTVDENTDIGNATTKLVASAPVVDGFSVNLNMLTVQGATDGVFDLNDFPQVQTDALSNAEGFESVSHEELTIGGKDAFVISYTIDQAGSRADGYQFYVPGSSEIYILTVTVPEGGDRTVADQIGQSLRVA